MGSGGVSGFTTVFGSGKATASHTLSVSELASHTHTVSATGFNQGTGSAAGSNPSTSFNTGATGSDAASPVGSITSITYIDVIIATKD